MPRPTKRTEETRAKLLDALAGGATRAGAIAAAGIDQNTFYRWLAEEKRLQQEVEAAQLEAVRARVDAMIARWTPRPRPVLTEEQMTAMLSRSSWGRLWLAETSATHRIVSEGRGYGRRGLRRIWRVGKKKRAVCGAKTRKGTPCRARCLPGKKRCRFHGGLSTGPRTPEGRAKIAESNRRRGAEARRASPEQRQAGE